MLRPRSVVGPVLALGLVLSGFSLSPAAAVPEPKIWGVVTDGSDAALLDVRVKATNADGDTVASDLSYEDPDGDQAPQPGYFELYVGSNGTFTVTLRKRGHESRRIRDVAVTRRHRVVGLGDVALRRVTETSAELARPVIRPDERGRVTVTVRPAQLKPTGEVVVKEGRRTVGEATLKRRHRGELDLTLDRLDRGTHVLTVVYRGSRLLADSASDRLRLRVKAVRSHRPRSNALAVVG